MAEGFGAFLGGALGIPCRNFGDGCRCRQCENARVRHGDAGAWLGSGTGAGCPDCACGCRCRQCVNAGRTNAEVAEIPNTFRRTVVDTGMAMVPTYMGVAITRRGSCRACGGYGCVYCSR